MPSASVIVRETGGGAAGACGDDCREPSRFGPDDRGPAYDGRNGGRMPGRCGYMPGRGGMPGCCVRNGLRRQRTRSAHRHLRRTRTRGSRRHRRSCRAPGAPRTARPLQDAAAAVPTGTERLLRCESRRGARNGIGRQRRRRRRRTLFFDAETQRRRARCVQASRLSAARRTVRPAARHGLGGWLSGSATGRVGAALRRRSPGPARAAAPALRRPAVGGRLGSATGSANGSPARRPMALAALTRRGGGSGGAAGFAGSAPFFAGGPPSCP